MESWIYVPGGKGIVTSETISSSDTFTRNKNALLDWDLKVPCSFGNNESVLGGKQAMDSRGFGELGYSELIGDELPGNLIQDGFSSKAEDEKMGNPFMVPSNSFGMEDDSTSRLSSFILESNVRDSCFIDLKLGRFGDPRDSVTSKGMPLISSSDSSMPLKRIRVGMNSNTAYCQVYGCNKDLSSSKDYHKRHKVCEVHSKTAVVIVNGIEQRFCQQCSRFHLLNEFDDGKRSCRKRLKGHNERRRKPQIGLHAGRAGRLLQSYNGFASDKFHGTGLSSSSFICQSMFPGGLLHSDKYGANDWSRRVKLEDGRNFNPLSAIPITGSMYNESHNQHPNGVGGPNSGTRPLFQESSLGNENFTAFDAASTIQGLSGITYSGCALSLLSPQSPNSSTHSLGIHLSCPLLWPRNNSHCSMSQVSEKIIGASPQASGSGMSNKITPTTMNSVQGSHIDSIPISDGSDDINFDVDKVYHGSHLVNGKDHHYIPSEDGTTINLLQLSSELQRVEHQKQSMQVKQENDTFCWPPSS